MKVQLLSLAMVIMMAAGLFGQKPPKSKRIEAMKIAFITDELQLTEMEAQKFWPIYNAYRKEQKSLQQSMKLPDIDNLSDSEASAAVNAWIQREKQMLDIKEDFLKKSMEVLPAKKVAKLVAAEARFKRRLLSRLRNRPPRRPNAKRPTR